MFSRVLLRPLLALVALSVPLACSETIVRVPAPTEPDAEEEPAAPAPAADAYPAGPLLSAEACVADHAAAYRPLLPAACASKRTCVDDRGRFWLGGAPFFPRGAYNNGADYRKLLTNCPAGAPCNATTPKDVTAYVRAIADVGLNLVAERSRYGAELLEAIHAEPRVHIAHLLWSDPFTQDGHDAMVQDVEAAAADPDVVMWFGPDEVDLNDNFAMAAGIRRILRGAGTPVDALLDGKHRAPAGAHLPANEPAHDPHGLPFGAALAFERGLRAARDVYDVSMPITYPFGALGDDPTNGGEWGTWRSSDLALGLPAVPVLQMVGIPEMGLAQPRAEQIKGLIASSLVHGARGAFYYTLIGDKPSLLGRKGWYAADDTEAWAAHKEMHALEDRLLPVLHASASERMDKGGVVEWRELDVGARRVLLVVNPAPAAVTFDLDAVVKRRDSERVRAFESCAPVTTRSTTLAGYGFLVLEVTGGA